jgi:lipid-binding SYLF domain-containing protein
LPEPVRKFFSKAFSLLEKEEEALEELHAESKATVRRMAEEDPGLQPVVEKAYAYAVFPSVGKATAVIGGAYGKGEVFQGDQLVGYAGLVQLTVGVQLGGQTFSEIVVFENEEALKRFKVGRTAFAANASAVLVKAGAAASSNYDEGAMVFVSSEGGMMIEAAIGAQKFIFKPAVLGRTKSPPTPNPGKSAAAAKTKTNPRRPAPARGKPARKTTASSSRPNARANARGAPGKSKGRAGRPKRRAGTASSARARG